MQIHVLASGSTGNALLVKYDDVNLLVDAGISARRIKNALTELDTAIEDIDGVLVTHEHTDHVSGLATLTKKYRLPVYARPDTWDSICSRMTIPAECRCELPDSLDIGPVKVVPFSISHDAVDPVGFNLFYKQWKCSVVTDLGFATDSVKKALSCSDVLVLEANHDLDMLQNGSYPWHLKRRIMSNRGHLSNTDAGWLLARMARRSHTKVLLAHLSQENNCPDLAKNTVNGILGDQNCQTEFDIQLTYPAQVASLILPDKIV